MRKIAGMMAAALIASSASAQMTTDCQADYLGQTHCRTEGQSLGSGVNWGLLNNAIPTPEDPVVVLQRGQQMRMARQAQAQHDQCMAQARSMIMNGDTERGQAYAATC